MTLEFDLEHVVDDKTDLFIAEGRGKTPRFSFVRIDNSIRKALIEAAIATVTAIQDRRDKPELYDPSNDYPSTDFLYFPLNDQLAAKARYIHGVVNPPEILNPLEVLPRISLYASRMYDEDGRSLTAVKSVSNFGRLLDRSFIARLTSGELRLIDEPQFQLSNDYDFLIDAQNILIYRHQAFENSCNLQTAIKEAIKENVQYISQHIDYIDFASIEAGVSRSVRAARELAAIRGRGFGRNLSQERLVSHCNQYNIRYSDQGGKMCIEPEDQMKFLQLLARKILGIQLRDDGPEAYSVSNRRPL